ncbi:MAG: hypothetical protein HDR05_12580 [Lachnospiraceae bacterium]|nr:hypothetical protein [Lachnospiraceae bacterium]
MKKEPDVNIEQRASKGVVEEVDNLVLQMLLRMIKSANAKNDEMLVFQLNACPHCQKQRIFLEDAAKDNDNSELCIICEKQVDTKVIVYQYEPKKQIICLEDEALALA